MANNKPFEIIIIFTLTVHSAWSDGYNYYNYGWQPKIEEPVPLKYFNLFLSNPYDPSQQLPQDINSAYYNRYSSNLTAISDRCPRDSFFTSYNPSHKNAVSTLAALYCDQTDFRMLIELSQFFKTQREIHPSVWYSSFILGQLTQMPETLAMQRPSLINLFPTDFFPERLMKEATQSPQECKFLDERFGQDNGIENRLWYFREDIQMNAHHWIWHLLYTLNSTEQIPRRGEFFYFFHHELVARYGAERISNGLPPQPPFNIETNSVVEEGYDPHLMNGISTLSWAARPPFQNLATNLNSTVFGDLVNLTMRRDRVLEGILAGTVFSRNPQLPFNTFQNINILGELTEASVHSIDPAYYGMDGFHNVGHFIFANLIGNSAPGSMGVMGDVATAMRDPIFYRYPFN